MKLTANSIVAGTLGFEPRVNFIGKSNEFSISVFLM